MYDTSASKLATYFSHSLMKEVDPLQLPGGLERFCEEVPDSLTIFARLREIARSAGIDPDSPTTTVDVIEELYETQLAADSEGKVLLLRLFTLMDEWSGQVNRYA